jgi:tRNA(fMet)-specific endonuclease VapC
MVAASYLLDTNVLSEVVKPQPNEKVLLKLKQNEHLLAIPSLVWHEMRYGWNKMPEGKKKRAIGDYLHLVVSQLPVFNYDQAAARVHAEFRASLEASGVSLSFVDSQIAAIAIVNGLTLVTRNTSDYQAIPNLSMTNWFE